MDHCDRSSRVDKRIRKACIKYLKSKYIKTKKLDTENIKTENLKATNLDNENIKAKNIETENLKVINLDNENIKVTNLHALNIEGEYIDVKSWKGVCTYGGSGSGGGEYYREEGEGESTMVFEVPCTIPKLEVPGYITNEEGVQDEEGEEGIERTRSVTECICDIDNSKPKTTFQQNVVFNSSNIVKKNLCVQGETKLCDVEVKGNLKVDGNATFNGIVNLQKEKVVSVPGDYPNLDTALFDIFFNSPNINRYRMILENQNHVLSSTFIIPGNPNPVAAKYNSFSLEYLSIEAASYTDHMGMYYGHLTGAYSLIGTKGETNLGVSGCAPFSLSVVPNATNPLNTDITVTGVSLNFPHGIYNDPAAPPGPSCRLAPNWVVGAPNSVPNPNPPPATVPLYLGISPNFNSLSNSDKIRWYDSVSNNVSEHQIVSIIGNKLTVTGVINTVVTKGSGFSVKPRATITVNPGQLVPAFIYNGAMVLNGLHFEVSPPASLPLPPPLPNPNYLSFVSQIWFEVKTYIDIRRCLSHIEFLSSSGARLMSNSPNTYMDMSKNTIIPGFPVCKAPALLISNAGGGVFVFRQTFVGPNAGFSSFAANSNTVCFSTWIDCDNGIYLHSKSGSKVDGSEFSKCKVGIYCDGYSVIGEASWFDNCETGVILRNSSGISSTPYKELPPLPDVPMVFSGSGTLVAINLDNSSNVYTRKLRMADVQQHAIIDGGNVTLPNYPLAPIVNASALNISNNGVSTYGTKLSYISANYIDVNPSSC